ncbi:hypothetical protein V8C86DRAFT_2591351 [Haematococcus lacustris]
MPAARSQANMPPKSIDAKSNVGIKKLTAQKQSAVKLASAPKGGVNSPVTQLVSDGVSIGPSAASLQAADLSEALDLPEPSPEDIEEDIRALVRAAASPPGVHLSEDIIIQNHAFDDTTVTTPGASWWATPACVTPVRPGSCGPVCRRTCSCCVTWTATWTRAAPAAVMPRSPAACTLRRRHHRAAAGITAPALRAGHQPPSLLPSAWLLPQQQPTPPWTVPCPVTCSLH